MKALCAPFGAAAISMATASGVAHHRGFRISDEGGYFYWYIVAPLAGALVGWAAYVGLRSRISGWRLAVAGTLIVGVIGVIGHAWALDHGMIGGEYLSPPGLDPRRESPEQLFAALGDRNQAVAGRAWVELEGRAERNPELMWRAVQLFRTTEPSAYVDSYRTLDAVAFLARRGDRRVVPVLREVLRSQETSLVTPPGGPSRVVYHNRVLAEDLLSRYFGLREEMTTPEHSEPMATGAPPSR